MEKEEEQSPHGIFPDLHLQMSSRPVLQGLHDFLFFV